MKTLPFSLHWRGNRDGVQTGWHIQATHDGLRYGHIKWQGPGDYLVTYNDGSVWRQCATHEETFQAAGELVGFYKELDEQEAQREQEARQEEDAESRSSLRML